MTAQASDLLALDGEEYSLAGVSGTGLFEPAEHGIEPFMISTGCWRGFVCRYAVTGDRLVLDALYLGRGSKLGGEPVEPGMPLLGGVVANGPEGSWLSGTLTLERLARPVSFTGTLLAGRDFVQSTYVHMGYQPAWRFARVVELVVDAGTVTARHDRSADMARIRDGVQAGAVADPDGERGGPGWIARTFRLGYDRTFGRE